MAPVRRWSATTRERAETIGRTERLGPAGVQRRLESETGERVPIATLSRWLLLADRKPRPHEQPTLGEVTDRAVCLASSELRRLERQSRPNLDDLAKLAQILKTLHGVKQAPKVKARTLNDLNRDERSSDPGTVRLAA